MEIAYSLNIFNYGVEDRRKKKRVVFPFLEARLLVKLLRILEARLLVKLLRINPKILRRHFDRDELKFHRIPLPDEC
jgi:hypothetical protein